MVGLALFVLMTALAAIRFTRYNLPVRVTEANLPFIYEQTAVMVAWIWSMLCLFVYIQSGIIKGVRAGEFHLSAAVVPVFVAAILSRRIAGDGDYSRRTRAGRVGRSVRFNSKLTTRRDGAGALRGVQVEEIQTLAGAKPSPATTVTTW